jgi:hypothetical protein
LKDESADLRQIGRMPRVGRRLSRESHCGSHGRAMVASSARRALPVIDLLCYARRLPEQTLLYRLVAEHYPASRDARSAQGRALATFPYIGMSSMHQSHQFVS